jgi:hypothetical protein
LVDIQGVVGSSPIVPTNLQHEKNHENKKSRCMRLFIGATIN